MFDFYIDDLAALLSKKLYTFYYADDLALLAIRYNEVKRAISIIKNWGLGNDMKLNKNKCGIINITNNSPKHFVDANLQVTYRCT